MEREIKFRGYSKNLGWIYGYYYQENNIHYIVEPVYREHIQVDEKSINQFTGLKDKNNVELYTDDIIKENKNEIASIQWHYGIGSYCWNYGEDFGMIDCSAVEKIGTLYENTQLLQAVA